MLGSRCSPHVKLGDVEVGSSLEKQFLVVSLVLAAL